MSLYNAIGGYFELELNNHGSVYHDDAIAVNSGRNALEYILLANKYKKIYVPYYTCDVTLQPIIKLNVNYEFYYLDNELLPILGKIKEDEAIIFVNYFGLMNGNIQYLQHKYKNIIVDNAQAFYAKPIKDIPTIYSPRKFFGLPDGGFVYTENKLEVILEIDKSGDKLSHLISRIEDGAEEGYKSFQINDDKLNDLPLRSMSILTDKLIRNIDFETIRIKRNFNFNVLHKSLKSINEYTPFIEKAVIDGPMVYPFLRKGNDTLRNKLIGNKIFVAKYWPNVINWIESKDVFEKYLFDNLIPLPIDQRYNEEAMQDLISQIKLLLN